MTPAARVAAAITCLDEIIAGAPAEQVLIRWARAARYAGSGDRRAVRDHVHDALRCRRSAAWVAGGSDGRALMIGVLMMGGAGRVEAGYDGAGRDGAGQGGTVRRGVDAALGEDRPGGAGPDEAAQGDAAHGDAAHGGAVYGGAVWGGAGGAGPDRGALDMLFTGEGHAPAPLRPHEGRGCLDEAPPAVRADLPGWLWPVLQREYGDEGALRIGLAQRQRAPLWLRVNRARTTCAAAAAMLAEEGIATRPHPDVATALEVTARGHRLRLSRARAKGLVEPQDAASQRAVLRLPLRPGQRILDYCAGGGGKALAVAALTGGAVYVHDADRARMRDIPARAARAGADIRMIDDPAREGRFDLVIADAPCSGSGTWRRTPDAKWRLTPARLQELIELQGRIARDAAALVAPGGVLAWMTCSVLAVENAARIRELTDAGGWALAESKLWLPSLHGDGFYLAIMNRT